MTDKIPVEITLHCCMTPEDIEKLRSHRGAATCISRLLKGYNVEIHKEAELDSIEIYGMQIRRK